MILWLLRPKNEGETSGLWFRWYDKTFGFVVRAETEEQARILASHKCGDEGKEAWLKEEHSNCIELSEEGESEVIIEDHHAA